MCSWTFLSLVTLPSTGGHVDELSQLTVPYLDLEVQTTRGCGGWLALPQRAVCEAFHLALGCDKTPGPDKRSFASFTGGIYSHICLWGMWTVTEFLGPSGSHHKARE